MEQVLELTRAAAPWIAMGLLLAIFAVRSVVSKKKGKRSEENYGTEGMCLGMCFGTALGATFGNNTGIGLSLGMLIGLAAGMCVHRKTETRNKR